MNRPVTSKMESQASVFSTVSGKGGVGKSLTTINIAETLARKGSKVAIIDADIGMPNCATLLNLAVPGSLPDVINNGAELDDLVATTDSGIAVITAVEDPIQDEEVMAYIYSLLDQVLYGLQSSFDYVLIDTAAGASKDHLWALDRSDMALLVLVDEPTVISNMYKLCKMVLNIDDQYPFAMVINRSKSEKAATSLQNRFDNISNYFFNKTFPCLGSVPQHPDIVDSINRQSPIVRAQPHHEVSSRYEEITNNMITLMQSMSLNNIF